MLLHKSFVYLWSSLKIYCLVSMFRVAQVFLIKSTLSIKFWLSSEVFVCGTKSMHVYDQVVKVKVERVLFGFFFTVLTPSV